METDKSGGVEMGWQRTGDGRVPECWWKVADKATFSSSAADAAEKVVEEAVWVLK
jgi:hypothetical protein